MSSNHVPKKRKTIEDDPESENSENEDEKRSNAEDDAGDERSERSEGAPSEESEGEDLLANAEADYGEIEYLDKYETHLFDDQEYDPLDYEARRAAEAELAARDQRGGHLRDLLGDFGSEGEEYRDQRRGRWDTRQAAEDEEEELEEESVNLEAFDVPLREWIAQDRTRREIKRRFKQFLTYFQPHNRSGPAYHHEKIRSMCAANLASLEVSYMHLSQATPVLAMWLADAPKDILGIFDEVLHEAVRTTFPEYDGIQDELHVRICELPVMDSIRDLREVHLNAFIKISGVVTRRSAVFPQLRLLKYTCLTCNYLLGPFQHSGTGAEIRPGSCPSCQSAGPFKLNTEETMYRNYQKITVQESPGTVPPGRVPRYKDVILLADLIDRARPGQEVEVTGVYTYAHLAGTGSVPHTGFPVFGTVIEANFIQQREDLMSQYSITDDEKKEIIQLSKDPKISHRIIKSIAPSIYGHHHMKSAVALSLFGGVAKNVQNKHRIRGDVNVLLLGDPGTAKSQVLKYVEKTAPRAVYTTGKGASAVGLTAAITMDPMTREWVLEGGALVIADKGVCLVDEFDKMNEGDRTSLHEAMEQQSISISKAGIVTTLQARCAIIAAANPIGGRYDASMTLAENVELTDPILQRFDILCVQQDTVDPIADEQLATFVVRSHRNSHPSKNNIPNDQDDAPQNTMSGQLANNGGMGDDELIPQGLLKKYIMYARTRVRPQLHSLDQEKIAQLYADLRKASANSGGAPIAVRHIESIMRMSEAHARMCLRETVREDDVHVAISVMLESFIQSQKYSVRRALQRGFRKYLVYNQDFHEVLLYMLQQLVKDAQTYQQMRSAINMLSLQVNCEDLEAKAREIGVYELSDFYSSKLFKSHNFILDSEQRIIIKSFAS